MAWFNADDKMHSHPKPRTAGLEAMGLWLVAGTYCKDYETEGAVPAWYVHSWPRGKQLAQKLVKARFWTETADGYQFRSWSEYQQTQEQVEEKREQWKERQRRYREKKRRDDEGDTA